MNWFSVEICRLYPGMVCPLFMASSFMRMKVASLLFDPIAKTVDGDKVGLVVADRPNVMNIPQEKSLYLTAKVDVVHVGIEDDFEHHLGIIGTTTSLMV